jgi:hypothetical protein
MPDEMQLKEVLMINEENEVQPKYRQQFGHFGESHSLLGRYLEYKALVEYYGHEVEPYGDWLRMQFQTSEGE